MSNLSSKSIRVSLKNSGNCFSPLHFMVAIIFAFCTMTIRSTIFTTSEALTIKFEALRILAWAPFLLSIWLLLLLLLLLLNLLRWIPCTMFVDQLVGLSLSNHIRRQHIDIIPLQLLNALITHNIIFIYRFFSTVVQIIFTARLIIDFIPIIIVLSLKLAILLCGVLLHLLIELLFTFISELITFLLMLFRFQLGIK